MRKKHLGIFLLFVCTLCQSQSKLYFGAKAGSHVNFTTIDHTILSVRSRIRSTIGINGGVSLKFLWDKKRKKTNTGIQISTIYMQRGWSQLDTVNTNPKYKARMSFLHIPLEGILYFGKKNKYFISIGSYLDFLLSFNDQNKLTTSKSLDFYTYQPNRDRNIGYGAVASLGVFRDFSFGSFQLEAFANYGMSNFINPTDLTTGIPDLSNFIAVGGRIAYYIPISINKKANPKK